MKKSCFTSIKKCYNKQLLGIHKRNFEEANNNMEYFVTYLKYLRDYYIINSEINMSKEVDIKVTSIIMAIAEYDAYQTCINKYYNVGNTITRKNQDESEEEVMEKYGQEKTLHWEKFWQFVNLNMES